MKLLQKAAALLVAVCTAAMFAACAAKPAPTEEKKAFDKQALVTELKALSFFENVAEPSETDLRDLYEIDTTLFQDSILLVDKNYNLCMMMIPAQDKSNDVKNMMSASLGSLAQQLELYQPEQSQRMRDRTETMRGDYLVYLATPDNNAALELITKALDA